MGKQNSTILIDYDKCLPCSELICIGVCPVGVLEAGANGKPRIMELVSCTRCDICASLCPAKAITVNQETKNT